MDPDSYMPMGSLIVEARTTVNWVLINQDNLHLLGFRNPLTPLIQADWARAQIRSHEDDIEFSVIRVFVLPDDVGRGLVERSDRTLLKHLQELLRSLDATLDAWEGRKPVDAHKKGYQDCSDDNDSLFYFFNTIPSPDPHAMNVPCTNSQESIDSLFEPGGLSGLRTQLHPYQKRTAATMIRREVHPVKSLDPRIAPAAGPLGHRFYYDSVAGRFYLNPRTYDEVAGGVLAESMGLGKTLICLATVLATKGHWPSIPPEHSLGLHPVRSTTGSLMQMAASAIARHQIPWRAFFQCMSRSGDNYERCLAVLEDNIGSYQIPPPPKRHSRRPLTLPQPMHIRLCPATIIIVPQNLLSQWQHEIALHFDEDTFKLLTLTSKDSTLMPEGMSFSSFVV